jgi:Ca2+-binding EF-hand superfamily protein
MKVKLIIIRINGIGKFNEAKYQKAVQQIFKKMDFNQDGVVTESDLDSLFAENRNDLTMFEPFSANRLQTVTGVKVAVMDFDENEDEVVDLNEFQQGMKKFENEKVHTDLCKFNLINVHIYIVQLFARMPNR